MTTAKHTPRSPDKYYDEKFLERYEASSYEEALENQIIELQEALKEIIKTCNDGVIHKNETGKPQWSALTHMGMIAKKALESEG